MESFSSGARLIHFVGTVEDLVGKLGTAITDLRPSGTALFDDERVDVVSESEWITEGTRVKVVSAEGYRHVVRPIETDETAEKQG